jgi:kanamycin kinase
VEKLAAGRPVQPVWENELGGLTFQIGSGHDRRFVKWTPAGSGIDLRREADRLAWAARWTAVPRLLDRGADAEGSWIVTAGLPGETAVGERWKARPAVAVQAIGRGLRALHDALPIGECPFSWSAEERLADVRRRAAAGQLDPAPLHPDHQHLDLDQALELVADPPPVDRLVVCHGDACAPNTLLDDEGRCVGHVDLGSLGVADRWADLAVASWSTQWNYGPGWEHQLLDAYDVSPDQERTRYYRLALGTRSVGSRPAPARHPARRFGGPDVRPDRRCSVSLLGAATQARTPCRHRAVRSHGQDVPFADSAEQSAARPLMIPSRGMVSGCSQDGPGGGY